MDANRLLGPTEGKPVVLCGCGKPADPVYGTRCEDCWAEAQPHDYFGNYRHMIHDPRKIHGGRIKP